MSKIIIITKGERLEIPLMDDRADCWTCQQFLDNVIKMIKDGRGLALELRPDRNVHGTLMGYHVAIAKEVKE